MTQCSHMLSNLGIMGEEIETDCWGHPILDKIKTDEIESTDYDNLVVVGVWMIAKENGSMLNSILNWIRFPISEDDTSMLIDA